MAPRSKQLIKGSIIRVAEFLSTAIVTLVMTPFIIHSLGDRMYGLWVFLGSFLGYYGLMDFGLSSAVQRFVSRAVGTNDNEEASKTASTALVVFACIGCLVILLSMVIAMGSGYFVRNPADVTLFKTIIIILGFNMAIGFPLRVFNGILSANLQFSVSSSISIVKLLVRTLFIYYFLLKGYGLITLAIITALTDLSGYMASYSFVKRLFPLIQINIKNFSRNYSKKLFSYSWITFIGQLADQLRMNAYNFIIAGFIGLSSITIYSIGFRLISYFMDLMSAATGMFMPVFSQLEGAGRENEMQQKFLFLTTISGYCSFILGGLMIIFGKPFIIRWIGVNYVDAYTIMLILIIPFTFALAQSPSLQMMYGISKHRFVAATNITEGIANVLLSIFLAKKYGIFGVAFGTAVPMMIMKIFVQPYYVCRILKISIKQYFLITLLPVLFKSSIILTGFWLLIRLFLVPDYKILFSFGFTGIVLCVGMIYVIGFNSRDKLYIKHLIVSFVK